MKLSLFISGVLPAFAVCALLAACAKTPVTETDAPLLLQKTAFEKLPGWAVDTPAAALGALQQSCAALNKKDPAALMTPGVYAGTAGDWQAVCAELSLLLMATDGEAREFFEQNFTPYAAHAGEAREGLFTGYYEPTLKGSAVKKEPYLYPLYGRPSDLVTVQLGDFRAELKGETIMGRVTGEQLVPYYTRAEIEKGVLAEQKKEIVYVDDPVDAFFLHVQGSGRVEMEDGTVLRVGYAAQNGRPYEAIGRALIARGALAKENVSMQSIRDWLEKNPPEAEEVMNINASYVFFRQLEGEGPLGAQGVALTPGRSLAVDRKKIPYGVPVFLDAEEPEGGARLQRLMVAQDTGGAIRGAVRGDFFWGAGDDAAHKAGLMKSRGAYYLLLPKMVIVPQEVLYRGIRAGFNN